jgi:hypothetical protein
MEPKDELVRLPCSRANDQAEAERAHIFHADCLQRWLLTSAACPICRRGVRPMLKARAKGGGCQHGHVACQHGAR